MAAALTADMISANLAPPAMAEPARDLLMAIDKRDLVAFEVAVRSFEKKVMLDPGLAAYGGRWLAGVAKNHVPGLSQVIKMEALVGELRGGGDTLSVWVAQCWVETAGPSKLVEFAEVLLAAWREVHTEHAMKFACALATSLAMVHTKVASRLISVVESTARPPSVESAVETAACWVDVGCVLSQLSSETQCLLEERLANTDRRWEWSSPAASRALEELRPHLAVPSKAGKLFQTIIWEDSWPVDAATQAANWAALQQRAAAAKAAAAQSVPKKEEPVRLLVLVTLLFAMTLVYNCVNAKRMVRPLTSVIEMKAPSRALDFGTQLMKRGVS